MTKLCTEIRGLLPYYIDNACPDDIRVTIETHMRTCPECSTEFKQLGGQHDRRGLPRTGRRVLLGTVAAVARIAVLCTAFLVLLNVLLRLLDTLTPYSNPYIKPSFETLMSAGGKTVAGLLIGIGVIALLLILLWKLMQFISKKLFPSREPEFEVYTVREGDTLISIAEKQYGGDGALALLKFLNNSIEQAVPGQELRLRLKPQPTGA